MKRKGIEPQLSTADESAGDIVRFWILRILLRLGGSRRLLDPDEIGAGDVASALGIAIRTNHSPAKPTAILPKLRAQLATFPTDSGQVPLPALLANNIDGVGDLLGLTTIERRLLALAVLARTERSLAAAMEMLGYLPTSRTYQAVAVLIDATDKEIREALSPRAALCRTGLLTVDRDNTSYLQNKMDVLSDGFAERMTLIEADPAELLRDKVFPSQPPTLDRSDFQHVQVLHIVARSHLALALQTQRKGTNILIHGVPGVGKTELARVLAGELGVELFEISSEDEDGDPVDGDRRLRAFRAAQWFFSKRKILFLFDEVEDVFSGDEGFFRTRGYAQRRKAWMNRMLETNPIPAIWITNQVHSLDPAFIRRFDLVVEVPNPPVAQRTKIIRAATGDLAIEEAVVARLASDANLTPAVVARAAGVVGSVHAGGSNDSAETLVLLVNSTLQAQGHPAVCKVATAVIPDLYDTDFINADIDLSRLADHLKPNSSARILLHGPPGTGKTAYARWLAKKLAIPLHVKRASDLLSMYVGQAEKLVAAAFEEAARAGGALLIDEIDSFLQDRRSSQASWEVSLVNEVLTQMEAFPGLLLASTNHLESLDQASLRRFDLKVGLGHLRPDQSWAMFRKACALIGLVDHHPGLEREVKRLTALTPGDFLVVLRQHALVPIGSSCEFHSALTKESRFKDAKSQRIGFI